MRHITLVNNRKKAHSLAQRFSPKIHQEWKNLKDSITKLVIADRDVLEMLLPSLVSTPTLYFRIMEDNNYYYAFYLVPHVFDWSDFPIKIIRELDSHLFDTEALCFRVSKKDHFDVDVATVAHSRFYFGRAESYEVFIESEGHGIYPYENQKSKVEVIYDKYRLENLDRMTARQWELIQKALGPKAKIPHEQADSKLLKGKKHRKGDMYLRPNVLFEIADEKELI